MRVHFDHPEVRDEAAGFLLIPGLQGVPVIRTLLLSGFGFENLGVVCDVF